MNTLLFASTAHALAQVSVEPPEEPVTARIYADEERVYDPELPDEMPGDLIEIESVTVPEDELDEGVEAYAYMPQGNGMDNLRQMTYNTMQGIQRPLGQAPNAVGVDSRVLPMS